MFSYASKPISSNISGNVFSFSGGQTEIAEVPLEEDWSPEIINVIKCYNNNLISMGRSPLINSLIIQVFHYLCEKKVDNLSMDIWGVKSFFKCSKSFSDPTYTIEKFQIVKNFVLLALVVDWYNKISKYMKGMEYDANLFNHPIKPIDDSNDINVVVFQKTVISLLEKILVNCTECLKMYFRNEKGDSSIQKIHTFQQLSLPILRDLFSHLTEFVKLDLVEGKINVVLYKKSLTAEEKEQITKKFNSLLKNNWPVILNEMQKNESKTNIIGLVTWIDYCLKSKDFSDGIWTADLINSLILEIVKKDTSHSSTKDQKRINKNNKIISGLQTNANKIKKISETFSHNIIDILMPLWNFHFEIVNEVNSYETKGGDKKNINHWQERKSEYSRNIEEREKEEAKQAVEKQLSIEKGTLKNASLLLVGAGIPAAAYMVYQKPYLAKSQPTSDIDFEEEESLKTTPPTVNENIQRTIPYLVHDTWE